MKSTFPLIPKIHHVRQGSSVITEIFLTQGNSKLKVLWQGDMTLTITFTYLENIFIVDHVLHQWLEEEISPNKTSMDF